MFLLHFSICDLENYTLTFEEEVGKHEWVAVFFTTTQFNCTYCDMLQPSYVELSNSDIGKKIHFAIVDCNKNYDLWKREGINPGRGMPFTNFYHYGEYVATQPRYWGEKLFRYTDWFEKYIGKDWRNDVV